MTPPLRSLTVLPLLLLLAPNLFAQPFGIDSRLPNTEIVITSLQPDANAEVSVERVFPNLSFVRSVALTHAGDGTGRLFHVNQDGLIVTFPSTGNPSGTSTFLDIRARVNSPLDFAGGAEEGLLGLAFDPAYASNGEFYVYYSAGDPRRTVLSRFTAGIPLSGPANANSEEILLQLLQPASNHNGGTLAFGPDNMLYLGLGDGGGSGDEFESGQDPTTLLGTIIRIDVRSAPDPALPYRIPTDNPLYNTGGGVRREILAYGLRNPYKFSFDPFNGTLFIADVGQDRYEEIDVFVAGQNQFNYGWNTKEGFECFDPPSGCSSAGIIDPIAVYSHAGNGGSASVTGGFVYSGSAVPGLVGAYIFGDFLSGRIFSLRYSPGGGLSQTLTELADTNLMISGFGVGPDGELYALDYFGGIYALRAQGGGGTGDLPDRLSDMEGLLMAGLGAGHQINGVFPYEPSAPFWSDGVLKERYFVLPDYQYPAPNYARMDFEPADGWNLPEDSVLIKNFLLPLDLRNPGGAKRRIETRLLVRDGGDWHGFSYEWNDAQTDAVLLTSGKEKQFGVVNESGQAESFTWTFPSRNQCLSCHTQGANRLLGVSTPQLNSRFQYPASGVEDNQLRTFDHLGLLNPPLPATPNQLPAMPDPFGTSAGLRDRARAYLAVNCASCHRLNGTAPTDLDFRWEVSDAGMKAIDVDPLNGNLGVAGAKIIKPGAPNQSVLYLRVATTAENVRMPPLARHRIDTEGAELIRQWILSMDGTPPPTPTPTPGPTPGPGGAGNAASQWRHYE